MKVITGRDVVSQRASFLRIFEPELDVAVFFGNDPVVADGAPVGVSADILDHFFGPFKRWF